MAERKGGNASRIAAGVTSGSQMDRTRLRRISAAIVTVIFLIVVPGSVAVLVPRLILGTQLRPVSRISSIGWLGLPLVIGGAIILLDSFARFVVQGLGTPAPVFPTRHLVVSGLYRYVRNPIYVAVLSLILGQAILFGSPAILVYGLSVWIAFTLFVLLYEEPTLRRTFGREYETFCANVPRWIPRLTPWPKD